mmetsp:Transcript_14634/g.31822  ORF Transcript_14634/g.31822 Transcript_14634/m.31822 type:complete len:274 (+) Transcript_14634:169-990(+)
MIVAFADKRRSSDGSHSNVIRKSGLHSSAGQMIVAFADRRRPSDESHSQLSRKSERRASSGPSSRRNQGGGPSRKQTSPAPMDPIPMPVTRRKADIIQLEGKVRSRRESETKGRSLSTRHSRADVIVGFPERNPRAHATKRQDPPGLWGSFRKHATQRESRTSSRPKNQPKQRPRQQHTASQTQAQHTRQFKDAVDWRHTSIDWGDEDEQANFTNDDLSGDAEPVVARQHRSKRNGVFSSNNHGIDRKFAFAVSLISFNYPKVRSKRTLTPSG